jgi:hypothetical protein
MKTRKSTVYEGCTPEQKNCPFIIKARGIRDMDELRSFLQDMFFAQYTNVQYHMMRPFLDPHVGYLTNITPHVHDTWVCQERGSTQEPGSTQMVGYIVMDRLEGNLHQFIHKYGEQLTPAHFEMIMIELLRLFSVLSGMNIWHKNMKLQHILYHQHDKGMDLYLIDWDNLVWKAEPDSSLQNRYTRLASQLYERMQREYYRAKKQNVGFRTQIDPIFNPASQDFRPILEEPLTISPETKQLLRSPISVQTSPMPAITSFTPPTPAVQEQKIPPQSFMPPSTFTFSSSARGIPQSLLGSQAQRGAPQTESEAIRMLASYKTPEFK